MRDSVPAGGSASSAREQGPFFGAGGHAKPRGARRSTRRRRPSEQDAIVKPLAPAQGSLPGVVDTAFFRIFLDFSWIFFSMFFRCFFDFFSRFFRIFSEKFGPKLPGRQALAGRNGPLSSGGPAQLGGPCRPARNCRAGKYWPEIRVIVSKRPPYLERNSITYHRNVRAKFAKISP